MNNHRILKNFGLVALFLLILGGAFFAFTRSTIASEAQSTTAVSATIGNNITYQGELNKDGNPVNDTCDMVFRLYNDNNTQVGGNLDKNNVAVSDGIFSVELDFGEGAFTGGGHYIQISVQCSGDASPTTLPNVNLTAAPYALSLRPGAIISGSSATTSTVKAVNPATNGSAYGLYGESHSNYYDGVGVFGRATAPTEAAKGVYGESYSTNGTGVFGLARGASGETEGVLGQAWSYQGRGVFGLAPITGTHGLAHANSGQTVGVFGQANSPDGVGVIGSSLSNGVEGYATSTTGVGNGVYGHTSSTSGNGVFGYAEANSGSTAGVLGVVESTHGTAVRGTALSPTGTNYGVFGSSSSPNGFGVYSEGNAHIDGNLTWKPITGHVSIPAAAFRPANSSTTFVNNGSSLVPSASSNFLAEVQLPHNATVTRVNYYWYDNSVSNDTTATLYRIGLDGTEITMAIVSSNGNAASSAMSHTSAISSPLIDNLSAGYYIWLDFPDVNFLMFGVTIEYTISQPY